MNRWNSSLYLMLLSAFLVVSCKNDSNPLFKGNEPLELADKTYNNDPNPSTANGLIKEIMSALGEKSLSKEKQSGLLEYGYNIANKHNISSREAAFLFPLVKNSVGEPGAESKLFDLANLLKRLNKPTAANTIYQGIIDNHPQFEKMDEVRSGLSEEIGSIDDYIVKLGEQIFVEPDNAGVNRKASLAFVDACEAYALAYPNSSKAPDNLFKAAEVAKSIRTFPKSLSIYDWIVESYPDYEKAATSLFLKGFIIENNLGDDEKAREIYNDFLAKYPTHDLADDVQFLIENLGKTDEEILQMIESRRKDK